MGSLPPPPETRLRAHSVAILGAGPSGLAAAKYLIAEQTFTRIVIYEQRSEPGGLWNHTPYPPPSQPGRATTTTTTTEEVPKIPVPQTSPHWGFPDEPIWTSRDDDDDDDDTSASASTADAHANGDGPASHHPHAHFLSPVYDALEANTARGSMGFLGLEWPDDVALFPSHRDVRAYLERYAEDVRGRIRFETQVVGVREVSGRGGWEVRARRLRPAVVAGKGSETETVEGDVDVDVDVDVFDAVVVAVGHYHVPYVPAVPGIDAFDWLHPGVIAHSKVFRRPDVYAGRKVVVVGTSASGIDIGAQIEGVCRAPLVVSRRSEATTTAAASPSSTRVEKPEIIEFVPEGRTLRFADGTEERDVDAVVYCTGYFFSYPFLDGLRPAVITTGSRVENLYQHIFYRPQPTLAFIGLPQRVVPFPTWEAQAAVVARVLAGRLALPPEAEMRRWEADVVAEMGAGRGFHTLPFPKDAHYLNALHDWARRADGERSGGRGKSPPRWGERELWIRERLPLMKRAFGALGDERRRVRTVEEAGFDFEKWSGERDDVEGLEGKSW